MEKRERRRNRLPEGWLQEFIKTYDIKSMYLAIQDITFKWEERD